MGPGVESEVSLLACRRERSSLRLRLRTVLIGDGAVLVHSKQA